MSDKTGIEWTDATWNPVIGCDKVSPGCDHCYAETVAHRFAGTKAYPNGFAVTLHPQRLNQPMRWTRPRRIFVNSMSDLFHQDVPDEYIVQVFDVMAHAPQHTFQLLTKRHARMRSFVTTYTELNGVSPNVWLGVSVESQQWADIRIPALLDTPAAVRFISAEPLLGPVDLHAKDDGLYGNWLPDRAELDCDGAPSSAPLCQAHGVPGCHQEIGCTFIDWVIVGGESGPYARPMRQEWARSLRDQCEAAGVAFLFKQWGEWVPAGDGVRSGLDVATTWSRHDIRPREVWFPGASDDQFTHSVIKRVGKKAAGRELDGRTWDEYPPVAAAMDGEQ